MFSNFFKRVRARYYVFSAVNPSKEVFDALIEAKKTWENKDAQVTIIPTHETETLFNWMSINQEVKRKKKEQTKKFTEKKEQISLIN